jgi:hypothetical protein
MTGRMYDFQMKFILVLDLKENSELFDDRAKDTVPIAYRNEVNQMKRIYVEFTHGGSLAGTTRSFFSMRQGIRMER